ncbi:hypothetical protein NQZ68_012550, partial [Dissostichus eleginoides]
VGLSDVSTVRSVVDKRCYLFLLSLILYANSSPSYLLALNRNLSNNKISLLRNGSFYGLAALEKLAIEPLSVPVPPPQCWKDDCEAFEDTAKGLSRLTSSSSTLRARSFTLLSGYSLSIRPATGSIWHRCVCVASS